MPDSPTTTLPILVAVGLTDAEAALHHAAREAVLRGAPLHLVHVLRVSAVDEFAEAYGGLLEDANAALATATRRARELTDDRVPVTSQRIDSGAVVPRLVQRADDAAMVVLQHRHLSHARRLVTGSTVTGVAARAQVPVVAVPEGWRPGDGPVRVTAAVQCVDEAPTLLRAALRAAQVHQATLTVAHAWWIGADYDDLPLDAAHVQDRVTRFEREMAPLLESLRPDFPDVVVTIDVRHVPPAELLLEASQHSALVVLGRRHHLLPLGTHLGPVARVVLDRSSCPVLMTPDTATEERPVRRGHAAGVRY